MSTPFQNRLVGTVIVAAIAIIFLPDILDGEKKTYQEEFDQIPSVPSIDFKPTNKQLDEQKFEQLVQDEISDETALDDEPASGNDDTLDTRDDSQVVKVSSLPDKETIIGNPPAKLPEKSVLKEAWVIQLGSFRHKKNVDELLKKLKDNGYTAFSKPIKTRTGNLTKVFIGPELIRSSLEKKIPELKKLTTVEGKIARFKPTNTN
ncbi:SPOR domain-containing protein [Thalassotalea profundi]|uniref:Cell division protein DedD n=1 Tax=Thalassotalea profundi TaxID=2036687 RepID=A0ABQ3IEA9_9GAMM|nr:SPOR domain-containing protein [Thalassotalea profundi]GHE77113.1 cell division protein DedD [Thalassotalea profundi]